MHDLTAHIYEAYGNDVSLATENALSDFKSSVDTLSNSLRLNERKQKSACFEQPQRSPQY